MAPLPSDLRGLLERSVIDAREEAEKAARAAVSMLAVDRPEPHAAMTEEQKRLRSGLRARARQLGNGSFTDGIQPLVEEIAYQQWHRMLFARFLAENRLLMHPDGVAVTLEECAELASEEGEPDGWMVAAKYASTMLPGIFRQEDPSSRVRFAPEGRQALESIVSSLPEALFTADDALGWVYQFWQTKKKREVNESGRKIGGEDLFAVTQLFTEDYMVRFLLENSLGAWWATRHPSSPLIRGFSYLRFKADGIPAAGNFPNWPANAAGVTVMDPCCGSGHFLVAAFEMLHRMRMEEEGLDEAQAGDAVLRDNLFGLEIDPRCIQIAAFALALAGWKVGGYRPLPMLNLACSGIPVGGQLDEWKRLANGDAGLQWTLERLHNLFAQAPDLGSLIDPASVPVKERMFTPDYAVVEEVLTQALMKETTTDPVAAVFGTAATAVARAGSLLSRSYSLVATNVPYLGQKRQGDNLKEFCEAHYPDSRADLATVFLERCRALSKPDGVYALVTPHNWLFQVSSKGLRTRLLAEQAWMFVGRLGASAFETISGEVVKVALVIVCNKLPGPDQVAVGLDASAGTRAPDKAVLLREHALSMFNQASLLTGPSARVVFGDTSGIARLGNYARSVSGMLTGDRNRFYRYFWEMELLQPDWAFSQTSVRQTIPYGGRSEVVYYQEGKGDLFRLAQSLRHLNHAVQNWQRGQDAWGKRGVAVSIMGNLPCSIYLGDLFDNSVSVIFPNHDADFEALWAFCSSEEFAKAVRVVNQKLSVDSGYFADVMFDIDRWRSVAASRQGFPDPKSDDPTQWLFGGDPSDSACPLQTAVARLLGYRWPQQESDDLERHTVENGIVCLPSVAGEAPAAERLRALLAAAFGQEWSPALQERLLTELAFPGKGLDEWLRDGYFAQHCQLFHNRPFIWHIWDGRRDGFSALVNYHKLDKANLNRLIYTYLGSWISARRTEREAGVSGAEGRLVAALDLQKRLELIRDGEPPYDIYVRWKPLNEQPMGWEPDLNDGVRLNIRPFVIAGVLRNKFTVNWNKDRGLNPDGAERLNDLHSTLAQKRAARTTVQSP